MNLQLSSEELDILLDLLNTDFKQLEIETLRSDKVDYHRQMQHRTEVVDGVLHKLNKLREPAETHGPEI